MHARCTDVMAYNFAVQSQKAVSAYLAGKQILPFGFADRIIAFTMYCFAVKLD